MGLKTVATIIALILAFSLLLPFFADVSKESGSQHVRLESVEMKSEKANESHADINFIIGLYRTKTLTNASLVMSIYDKETGLLIDKIELEIPEKGEEGISELETTLSFEKDKDYNIAFKLEKERRFVDSRGISLKGLNTLHPRDKELKLSLKDVDFQVINVTGNSARIKARFYLETLDDYHNTVFHIKAIQFESNVLADEKWLDADLDKGKTLLLEENLTVPENYNYIVKIEAWRNKSLLKTWSKGLNLAPTKRIPEKISEEKVVFEAGDFIQDNRPVPGYAETPYPEGEGLKAPGFELITFLTALGGATLWKRRYRKNTQ